MAEREKVQFVLIHGACHGAWCWYKVVTLLRSSGHKVSVLDMAASGVHPKRVEEISSYSDYAEPLMEFMQNLPSDVKVILVGHSMGGITISLAMEKFPHKIAVAVFVTAFSPGPDLPITTILPQYYEQLGSPMDTKYGFGNGEEKPPTSLIFGPEFLASKLYQLSPPEDLELASLLVRPVALLEDAILLKELAPSKEKYGLVRRVYIVADKDNVLMEDFQRWMIEKNPVDEVMDIRNSDHMVMLSKPRELFSCLGQIFEKYTN